MLFDNLINIQIIAVILGSLSNLFIGVVVLKNNPKSKINIVAFLNSLFLGLWGLSLVFYQFPFILSSILWIKITFVFVALYTSAILEFSFIFPSLIFPKIRKWARILSLGFICFTAWLLFSTKIWIIDVVTDPQKGLQTIWGNGYYLWLTSLWIIIIWTFINFLAKYRNCSSLQRLQMKYFFLSFGILAVVVQIPDVLIPILFNDTRYFFISAIVSFIFSGAVAYAIIKHRLMDIRLVIARSVAYLLLIISLGAIYAFGLFLATSFIIKEPASVTNLSISTALALIIAFSFQPLLGFFQKITNRIFYKQNYDENELVHNLALIMASTINLPELTHELLDKILAEIHISRGAFVLVDNKKIFHLAHQGYVDKPQFPDEDLNELIKQSRIVIFDEMRESHLKETMRKLEISIVVPLRAEEEHEDFLILGEKLSGNPYADQDIRFLEAFAPEAAIAIKNASNVERLMRLDEMKSEFITVTSHQLRTPLSSARWNFELLLQQEFGKIPIKANRVIRDIYRTMMILNEGVNNMMAALEIEEGKVKITRQKVQINKNFIDKTIDILKGEIKIKNITIKRKLFFKNTLRVDPEKISRVFEILLDNAIRYSPNGSVVTVFTAREEKENRNELVVAIEDEGMGILRENRELIFQKFFRGGEAKKMSPSGFGLGLFTAQKYIELHGGRLWLGEKQGPGSIFYFTVPITEVETEPNVEN